VTDATGLARDFPGSTVQFVVDGTNYGAPQALVTNRDTGVTTASISYQFAGYGKYTIAANYGGSSDFLASTGSTSVNVIEAPK
jgi:hypothetical protein